MHLSFTAHLTSCADVSCHLSCLRVRYVDSSWSARFPNLVISPRRKKIFFALERATMLDITKRVQSTKTLRYVLCVSGRCTDVCNWREGRIGISMGKVEIKGYAGNLIRSFSDSELYAARAQAETLGGGSERI
jgi:hypothetical protein